MPELAAAYFAGLVACLALTILYVFLRKQVRKTDKFITVQANLKKAGLYWCANDDSIISWNESREQTDIDKSSRGPALAGSMLSLLSWAGFFFLLLIMLSERYLARSRKEKKLFASPLATSSVSASEVEHQIVALELGSRRQDAPRPA